ncbi:MAG: hypothetical protein M1823_005614 [Watsoniomyces obsoletus]|nr:MAG: hypothetical protein M1823_005614 [Watsoniomyces obsoletus]
MNYTGDVLNFGMAVEKVKAASSGGINIETVIVGDDVGVGKKQAGKVGRRGIAGTVLVHKIAGALAATGASFKEVHHVAQLVSENLISVGASLGHVHVPGSSKNNSESRTDIESNEIEIGMGIHNEPGSQTIQSYDLPSLIKKLLSQLLDQNDEDRAFLEIDPRKHKMVLMVNNLGGVSVLEMGGITTEVVSQLKNDYDVKPVGILSGVYMTSLNGMGFSITLLRLMDTGLGVGKDMLDLLDAPAQAVGWSNVLSPEIWSTEWEDVEENNMPGDTNGDFGSSTLKMDPSQAERALKAGLESIVAAEPEITDYDTKVGDGDCGISLKRGAEAILNAISHGHLPLNDAIQTTSQISQIIENTMDGTSGAIYS